MHYFGLKVKKQFTGLSDKFIEKLEAYNWPGNIRELKNIIERAVILADDNFLDESLLPYEMQEPQPEQMTSGGVPFPHLICRLSKNFIYNAYLIMPMATVRKPPAF